MFDMPYNRRPVPTSLPTARLHGFQRPGALHLPCFHGFVFRSPDVVPALKVRSFKINELRTKTHEVEMECPPWIFKSRAGSCPGRAKPIGDATSVEFPASRAFRSRDHVPARGHHQEEAFPARAHPSNCRSRCIRTAGRSTVRPSRRRISASTGDRSERWNPRAAEGKGSDAPPVLKPASGTSAHRARKA